MLLSPAPLPGTLAAMDALADLIEDLHHRAHRAWADGDGSRAGALARLGLRHDPGHPGLLGVLGAAELQAGRAAEAALLFRRALERASADPAAWHNLGVALLGAGHQAQAIVAWQGALARDPARADTVFNLARAHDEQDHPAQARPWYTRAARLGQDGAAFHPLGTLLIRTGEVEAGEQWLRAAVCHDPAHAGATTNLGWLRRRQGNLDHALRLHERAVRLTPTLADAHWNRASVLLAQGRYPEGFAEWEWRTRRPGWPFVDPPVPPWTTQPLAGRTLLVLAEQGAGDMIQMARFLPALAAQGARVVVEAPPGLAGPLAGVSGVAAVVPYGEPETLLAQGADFQVRAFSLPQRLGLTAGQLPACTFPYLPCPPPAVLPAAPASQPGPPPLRVGVCWSGNPAFVENAVRAAPLAAFAPLATVPGVCLYSLQLGDPARALPGAGLPITDLAPLLADYGATAAVLMALDLVITTDTSVAHLAGALGRPGLVLLAAHCDWRWGIQGQACAWYPSLTLLRQTRLGDWSGVVAEAAGLMEARARRQESARRSDTPAPACP
ncbi:tetratricopeptide repeat protein [Pararhodospirillum oryzae]|uniref:Uncharacterized protein n=1 Tax=Pararhodospirillum oryzae TaxID=478448 RepID=A0A512H840_9PROT|nr:tetratricopeptide repeat protein [Pararhodospirillum oryzae]GEO81613.1 hypothetical protein ROR02_17440 [Pararhodospirillum oryzae]